MHAFKQFVRQMLGHRRMLFITLVAAVLDSLCAFAGFGALMQVINVLLGAGKSLRDWAQETLKDDKVVAIIGDQSQLAEHIPHDPFKAFVLLLMLILALTVLGSVFRFIYQYMAITLTYRTVMEIRKNAYQRLVHLPMETIIMHGTADSLGRIVRDCGLIARGLNALLGKTVRDILIGSSALTVAVIVDWRLTAIFLLGLPILAVLIRKFGKRIRRASKAAMAQYGRMIGAIQESMQASRVVKVHQAEGYERRRFNTINREVWTQEMKARTARAMSSPVIELMAITGIIAVAIVAAGYVFETDGSANPADILKVIGLLGVAGMSFRPIANLNNDLQEAAAASTRVMEILDMDVEPNTRDHAKSPGKRLSRHNQSVRFENVMFKYPNSVTPALLGVNLEVKQGMTCAVVGSNGSGKSTMLALLPRLYHPTQGQVLIDGVDIGECSLRSVRKQMAMVTQDTVLFDGSIADNITYGQRHISDDAMFAAARRAHAHEFISALPEGYNTQIGEWGGRLSGGQKQRIAIARAILRDPAILILDEATSQIDAESESHINAALNELMAGRTTFVIAHRLSTVIHADLIVVLKDGHIIDQGKHDALLRRCEVYQQLSRTQLSANVA